VEDDYWKDRSELDYYRVACNYVKQYLCFGTVLDVGGAVGLGCTYLSRLPTFERTSVELSGGDCSLDGVNVIHKDFMAWDSVEVFDAVLCLQVLEHVPCPTEFATRLFSQAAQLVVISVPYCWPTTACAGHLHDPVDEQTLQQWTGRKPTRKRIVDRRLVAAYVLP